MNHITNGLPWYCTKDNNDIHFAFSMDGRIGTKGKSPEAVVVAARSAAAFTIIFVITSSWYFFSFFPRRTAQRWIDFHCQHHFFVSIASMPVLTLVIIRRRRFFTFNLENSLGIPKEWGSFRNLSGDYSLKLKGFPQLGNHFLGASL